MKKALILLLLASGLSANSWKDIFKSLQKQAEVTIEDGIATYKVNNPKDPFLTKNFENDGFYWKCKPDYGQIFKLGKKSSGSHQLEPEDFFLVKVGIGYTLWPDFTSRSKQGGQVLTIYNRPHTKNSVPRYAFSSPSDLEDKIADTLDDYIL